MKKKIIIGAFALGLGLFAFTANAQDNTNDSDESYCPECIHNNTLYRWNGDNGCPYKGGNCIFP